MSGEFIDTNVFIYLFDETDVRKRNTAERLVRAALETRSARISHQVVQETLNVVTRKLPSPMTAEDARHFLEQVLVLYVDPPYGIKFNSNFQWSTTNRDVKDGKADHITREPEQVKAFRDTWRDGIHSYLTYLRDRLTVACDLLTESGSIFVQIGDENVHRVQVVMDRNWGLDRNWGQSPAVLPLR
jgi:predicted nucleic acid-binding protein